MLQPLTILSACLALAHVCAAATPLEQPLRITGGLVQGVPTAAHDVVSFKGIPYAAPPVEGLRWREPQPPLAWDGIRRADAYGASCPQKRRAAGDLPDCSEDCLFLNVWAPTGAAASARPVLFFIHGGADQFGSGSSATWDGEALARRGIIVVTVNFRLGILGGFAHPELTAASPHRASGNYGLLDVIAALRWVQDNIRAFNGDAGRITIAGHSSGTHTVHHLTISPLARGLFHRAIALSFPQRFMMTRMFIGDLQQREQHGVRFAAARQARSVAELRRIPAMELIADDPAVSRLGLHLLGIIKDGWAIPERYMPAVEQGLGADVPVMIGLTADDFGCIARCSTTTVASFAAMARERFGDRADAFLALHPAATDAEARIRDKEMQQEKGMADIFHWAAWRAARATTPVYSYFFTQAPPRPDRPEAGAFHGSDVVYGFDNLQKLDHPWTGDDRRVAALVSSYWVNFIVSGDPNGPDLPTWKPVATDDPTTMVLGVPPGPRRIASPERMDFYRTVVER